MAVAQKSTSSPSRLSKSTFGQKSVPCWVVAVVSHPLQWCMGETLLYQEGLSRTRANRITALGLGSAQVAPRATSTTMVTPVLTVGPWAATCIPAAGSVG